MGPVIDTPRGSVIQTKNGAARLVWNKNFKAVHQEQFTASQKFVDSEVLRLSTPFVPIKTSMLIKSGQLGTVPGSGEASWIAPYARNQYYNTATSRPYDPQRGAYWFERMKAIHRDEIVNGAKRIAGGSTR